MADLPKTLVADAAALARCAEAVARAQRVALDTESNGFHAYFEKVCLVQLATDVEEFAVDTLAVGLGPLQPLIEDPAREVVLHAAEFDVLSLRRDYGLRMGRIFDTHAAAKTLGLLRFGLGNLLEDQLGVKLLEDEQRSDWGKRPLSPSQLSYAFADVAHLLALRDLLGEKLHASGHEPEARAEFERLRTKEPRPRTFDPEGWQKLKAARTLDGRGRAVLRALFLLRDARARELDRPPFKVLSELFLAEVARRQPKTEEQLAAIPGASPQQLRKLAAQVLAAVQEAQAAPPPGRPRPQQKGGPPWKRNAGQDPVLEARYEVLRAWRKQRAEARKVEVQVIAPNAVLLAVAKADPRSGDELARVEGMDPFRVEQYGGELVAALAAHREREEAPAAAGASSERTPQAPPAGGAPAAAEDAPADAARAPPARPAPVQGKLFD